MKDGFIFIALLIVIIALLFSVTIWTVNHSQSATSPITIAVEIQVEGTTVKNVSAKAVNSSIPVVVQMKPVESSFQTQKKETESSFDPIAFQRGEDHINSIVTVLDD